MSLPLYVLLPDGAEWSEVPGTTAQTPKPVRWYLRQQMVDAATQPAVLVDEGDAARAIGAVVERAHELGGVVVDAGTGNVVEQAADVVS
jgi:hypothetical protein